MKYRRLNQAELSELETAFIRFLATQGISADDWVKIKAQDEKRTAELIDTFSDVVFHETLTKIEYLEFKTAKELKSFHCLPDKIKLIGLVNIGESELDFTKNESPQMMAKQIQENGSTIRLFTTEKKYHKEREVELFELMENGCLISNGEIYKLLEQLS